MTWRLCLCASSNSRSILDRDDGLVGEGEDELDLRLGKGFDGATCKNQDADGVAVPHQRRAEKGPVSGPPGWFKVGILGICKYVGQLDQRPIQEHATDDAAAPRVQPTFFGVFEPAIRKPETAGIEIAGTLAPANSGHIGSAQAGRGTRQRIENDLQVHAGPADRLEDLCGRGLFLSRLCQFATERANGKLEVRLRFPLLHILRNDAFRVQPRNAVCLIGAPSEKSSAGQARPGSRDTLATSN